MKKISLLIGILLLLSACGSGMKEPTFEELKDHAYIVESTTEEGVFVNYTSFKYIENVKLRTNQGERIKPTNIKKGSLIWYEDTGEIMESYPMQGTIKQLTLYDDELSRRLEKGIAYFLNDYDMSDFIGVQLVSLEGEELIIQFKDFSKPDEVYFATINVEALKYEVIPQ
ncbi:hypothetical protein [Paenisporosarcina antarctica]|uniref:DUF3221 domain-containing protein n=1 Tax=Paenisporosarcina antarctica TaxID=417367 RepID=A0A4P7A2J0_9BACL|nr:hypothetical protein [Paenisporosarcina antarctica]QBP42156.1 hypothetical protein E2636_13805 [Paenisporosarcina antarctica]